VGLRQGQDVDGPPDRLSSRRSELVSRSYKVVVALTRIAVDAADCESRGHGEPLLRYIIGSLVDGESKSVELT
jgi:hypothetical protein